MSGALLTVMLPAIAVELRQMFIHAVLLPPGNGIVMLLIGVVALRYKRRFGVILLCVGIALLYALSTPLVAVLLTRTTGSHATYSSPGSAGAIVILAAEKRWAAEYGGLTVGPATLERLRLGAKIARETGLPILLSGGRFHQSDTDSMAALQQRVLLDDYGLTPAWLEEVSRDTRESAAQSAPILRQAGVSTVVLVTHYAHMRRAQEEFRDAGISSEVAPVAIPVSYELIRLHDCLPTPRAMGENAMALYELIALLVRPLRISRTAVTGSAH